MPAIIVDAAVIVLNTVASLDLAPASSIGNIPLLFKSVNADDTVLNKVQSVALVAGFGSAFSFLISLLNARSASFAFWSRLVNATSRSSESFPDVPRSRLILIMVVSEAEMSSDALAAFLSGSGNPTLTPPPLLHLNESAVNASSNNNATNTFFDFTICLICDLL